MSQNAKKKINNAVLHKIIKTIEENVGKHKWCQTFIYTYAAWMLNKCQLDINMRVLKKKTIETIIMHPGVDAGSKAGIQIKNHNHGW